MPSRVPCHRRGSADDDFAARRQAGAQRDAHRSSPPRTRIFFAAARSRRPRATGQPSGRADIAARLVAVRLPRPTSSRSRKRFATIVAPMAPMVRSIWARTRMRCPARLSAPRSKFWPPTTLRRSSSEDHGVTPTPVISHAILVHNRGRTEHLADGIVITPSHNPPEDGGFKYNPTNGGPADTDVTQWVEHRANKFCASGTKRSGGSRLDGSTRCVHDAPARFRAALRQRPAQRRRYGRRSRRRPQTRRRPAGRRRRALLGTDQRDIQTQHRSGEPERRPDLLVHDRRS